MDSLDSLREEIQSCRRCPRLVVYRERVAREKKREFRDEVYWGRPVPGFGDPRARLFVLGLAPAPHGGNRTGRVFTGDRSAAFLVRGLYATGYANQPTSTARHDGLKYSDAYISAALRCVPPDNRPTPEERDNCYPFLERELRLLPRLRAALALGSFAWDQLKAAASAVYGVPRPSARFEHGACAPLGPGRPLLWASFHPSPRNVNTGKLSETMFLDVLRSVRDSYLSDESANAPRHAA
jgi:uracil-DNA glycosylase